MLPFELTRGEGSLLEKEWYFYKLFPGQHRKRGNATRTREIAAPIAEEEARDDDDGGDNDDYEVEDDGGELIVDRLNQMCKLDFKSSLHDKTHRESVKRAFLSAGISSKKVTHAFRSSAAIDAAENRASETSIRNHGRWNGGVFRDSYQRGVDKSTPIALAGFDASTTSPTIERSAIPVPRELQELIFPFLEEEMEGYNARVKSDASKYKDNAFERFVKLLQWL